MLADQPFGLCILFCLSHCLGKELISNLVARFYFPGALYSRMYFVVCSFVLGLYLINRACVLSVFMSVFMSVCLHTYSWTSFYVLVCLCYATRQDATMCIQSVSINKEPQDLHEQVLTFGVLPGASAARSNSVVTYCQLCDVSTVQSHPVCFNGGKCFRNETGARHCRCNNDENFGQRCEKGSSTFFGSCFVFHVCYVTGSFHPSGIILLWLFMLVTAATATTTVDAVIASESDIPLC